jgi:hypothetical protein
MKFQRTNSESAQIGDLKVGENNRYSDAGFKPDFERGDEGCRGPWRNDSTGYSFDESEVS